MTSIIMQAYQVLDEIKKDSTYQKIKQFDRVVTKLYQEETQAFQKARAHYDQIMNEGGTYHPDFKDAVRTLSEAKSILYSKEEVKTYFEFEKKFETELNDFLFELTQAVSSHIKTPDKMGIIKKGGSCHVR
ncbi:MAG TPA: hypothetical protein DEG42_01875 [Acholeplasmataceae bacterium]|nr:MAG: hypothetical protein A2Y43_03685 [Tenericutes bacterium GWA2_38_26]OHE31162.1 MAG: hypothetical protein A2084_01430 [Tenericutes bacterium GWC2_39_45]OHE32580.1 MAG: hypothetical protein A2009_04770 [Tenericutes bacterium GWD2_38_27]OHE39931.1 MAG: hypothetical protein A2013_05840 [Tenericutes bacterium GWE2_38_8]OHE41801.1 MAG: hypothetical protein A2102_01380 [Tenericutes bacterium GWF2_38_8]HBG32687.1 hypothetical protein [Acholeplasmataceae bacterium]